MLNNLFYGTLFMNKKTKNYLETIGHDRHKGTDFAIFVKPGSLKPCEYVEDCQSGSAGRI